MSFLLYSLLLYTPSILFATLLAGLVLGFNMLTLLYFVSTLCAMWSLSSALQNAVEQLGAGRLFSFFIVPWLTTFPETLTTIMLVRAGYPIAGLFNGVFSAVFDLFLVLPLLTLGQRVVLGLFMPLGLGLVLIPFTVLFLDLKLSAWWEGAILVAVCVVLTLLPALKGGFEKRELSAPQLVSLILTIVASVIALVFTTLQYVSYVESMCAQLGEEIGGILSAYLTSLPDAVYALVLREEGEVEEAIGELWACVVHDFTENFGFAPLFGGVVTTTMTDIVLSIAVILAFVIAVATRRLVIDEYARLALFGLFAAFTVTAILL